MAIKIFEKYGPRANPADADYPYGSVKNESVPGANDGTPLEATWANDYAGADAALFAEAGIVPNGQPDTVGGSQRVEAIKLLEKGASKVTNANGGSVQDFIDAQYTTVAELATGKFTAGQYVRLTDRAMGLFLLQSGGTHDGYGILDAGNGNTAVAEKSADIRVYGGVIDSVTDNTDVISYMLANRFTGSVNLPAGGTVGKYVASELYNIGLVGNEKIYSRLLVPDGGDGMFLPAGTQLRDTKVADLKIAAQNALTGTGINTGDGFAVNTSFENLGLNDFDIGLDMKSTSFSNVFSNVRANGCRRSFNFVSNGQCINNTFNGLYSSQPTKTGMYISGCKNFVFNTYNSGSSGAPHLDIAGGSTGIIFNAPNFEQDSGTLAANSQAITVQSNCQVTFNQPVFASPKAAEINAFLFRVKNSATVHINNPVIVGADANIQHLFIEDDAVVYLYDPKGVFTPGKIKISDNGKLVRLHEASGKIASHPAGGLIYTGLNYAATNYSVSIDYAAIGDEVLDIIPQVTQVGTGTLKVRYFNMTTNAESYVARPLIWSAK